MRDLTLDIESSAWAELREFLRHPTYTKVQLQQVCTIVKAHSSMGKAQFASEGVPYIHYGQLHGQLLTCAHTACTFADPASCAQATWAQRGDVILTGVSENLDGVAKPLAWLGDQPAVVSGGALVLQHNLDPLYLSCALQSSDFRQQLSKVVNKSTLLNLRTTRLRQLSINIPPPRIQELIGKFLSLGVARRRVQPPHTTNSILDRLFV